LAVLEYKKKDLPCANIIAFFTSFIDVQDSMTDVTRLLENPVEATTIVQNFVLLVVENVI
jgi:hypothetical protein